MGRLEEFVGCTIKRDLTKTTLNISQPHIITKTTQGISITRIHRTRGLYVIKKHTQKYQIMHKKDTAVAQGQYYTLLSIHNPNYLRRYENYQNICTEQT